MGDDPVPGHYVFLKLWFRYPDLNAKELEDLKIWLKKKKK